MIISTKSYYCDMLGLFLHVSPSLSLSLSLLSQSPLEGPSGAEGEQVFILLRLYMFFLVGGFNPSEKY